MNEIRKFIQWLSFHPTWDQIARALATDYLAEFSVQGVRFSLLQNDGSIMILGQFGFEDSELWADRVIPSIEWRGIETEPAGVLKGQSKERWSNNATVYIETLFEHGVTQGHLMVVFLNPIKEPDREHAAEIIQDLSAATALYLSWVNKKPTGLTQGALSMKTNPRAADLSQLTQRQILILHGMVEGKTNHELATELGFSVSTIRHETMRIYQALSVSDRKEAAKKALMLSLV